MATKKSAKKVTKKKTSVKRKVVNGKYKVPNMDKIAAGRSNSTSISDVQIKQIAKILGNDHFILGNFKETGDNGLDTSVIVYGCSLEMIAAMIKDNMKTLEENCNGRQPSILEVLFQ